MSTKARRYDQGSIIALVAGIIAIGIALWGVPMRASDARIVEPIAGAWGFFAGAGGLAVLAVLLTRRARSTARGLLVLAGFVLLMGTLLLWEIGWPTRIATVLLGVAMIVSSMRLGRR